MASKNSYEPNYDLLSRVADECFMPLGYGGGIKNVDQASRILEIGFEKVVINSHGVENPQLIEDLSKKFGSQAIISSIDIKKNFFGKHTVRTFSGNKNTKLDPVKWARKVESLGAGEILLTSIDQEGTWNGFDLDIINNISSTISIPLIAHGGAGNLSHLEEAIKIGKASAVGLGSMVVFQKKGMGVLINFPSQKELEKIL